MPFKEVEGSGKWDWEKVGEFEGKLVGSEPRTGQNGKEYILFTLKESTSGEEFKMSGIVLEGKLAKVAEGDKVHIVYKGQQRGAGGTKYNDFSVQVWED